MFFSPEPDEDLQIISSIHDYIIAESGGATGYHDINLVKSALARPTQSAFGKDAYIDLYAKAAAFLDSVANNHGFRDGNKRTAMAGAIYYLSLNGIQVSITNEEYETFMLQVVNVKPSIEEIGAWLMEHSERVIPKRP